MTHRFSEVKKKHLDEAGRHLDKSGLDPNAIFNNYYIELNNGREYPFKQLAHQAYKIVHGSDRNLNFQHDDRNEKIITDLGVKVNHYTNNINPFQTHELELFEELAGKRYHKDKAESQSHHRLILPLVKKLNYWTSKLEIFDLKNHPDNGWLWPGGIIREYLWIRIFKQGDSGKVFFDVGIDSDGSLYLDLNPRTKELNKKPPISSLERDVYDKYIKSENITPLKILKSDKHRFSWESLIKEGRSYIEAHINHYHELELILNKKRTTKSLELKPIAVPNKIPSHVSANPSFRGYADTNWEKKNKESTFIGVKGEEFIINLEKESLKRQGLEKLAENVKKVLDGNGYDILSYFPDGSDKYIEVKTTIRDKTVPFQLTYTEKRFINKSPTKTFIYRVFNYDPINHTGEYYIIKGNELNSYTLKPLVYEVSK